jgi:hypothetical protein
MLFLIQNSIELFCISLDYRIDDRPNDNITNNENCRKDYDRYYTEINPIVDKISAEVADVQDASVNENCHQQWQALDLINRVQTSRKEGKRGQRKYSYADLIHCQSFNFFCLMQYQINDRQNDRADARRNEAPT